MTEHIAQGTFTYVARGIASVLITPVFICAAYDPQGEDKSTFREYSAIWDTGATKTMVTKHLAEGCGLVPTAQSRVQGVFGAQVVNGYLVNIVLPTQHPNRDQKNVAIQHLSVLEAPALTRGHNVLIGMDIISKGDFAISNYRGRTMFTYRIPSRGDIDFGRLAPFVS